MTSEQHQRDRTQRMRLVYTGDEESSGGAAPEVSEAERMAARRRVALVASGALALGVLLVFLMSLGGGASDPSAAKPDRGPIFGYVVKEARGPGLKPLGN